jgi:hypothetical protein
MHKYFEKVAHLNDPCVISIFGDYSRLNSHETILVRIKKVVSKNVG